MNVNSTFLRLTGITKDFIPEEEPNHPGVYIVPNCPSLYICKDGTIYRYRYFDDVRKYEFRIQDWQLINNSYHGIFYDYEEESTQEIRTVLIPKILLLGLMFLEKPDNFENYTLELIDKEKEDTLDNIEFRLSNVILKRNIINKNDINTFTDLNVPDGYKPIEHPQFPGFYLIPEFPDYCINPTTLEIMSIRRKIPRKLTWIAMHEGYRRIALCHISGRRVSISRHRLLALMFLRDTVDNPSKYVVNHKDGIPGNDYLENLEFISEKENINHANSLGNTHRHKCVQIRYIETKETMIFRTAIDCARYLSISRDQILRRIALGPTRLFPEGIQYRTVTCNKDALEPWPEFDNIKEAIDKNTNVHSVVIKDCFTKEEIIYHSSREAAKALGIGESTLSIWINEPGQKVHLLPDGSKVIQCKLECDNRPFRKVLNMYDELSESENSATKIVIVHDTVENKRYIYPTIAICAKERHLLPNTLSWRLKSKGETTFNDGCRYYYYTDMDPSSDIEFIHWS